VGIATAWVNNAEKGVANARDQLNLAKATVRQAKLSIEEWQKDNCK
jgi:hypothetical protein